MEDCDPVQKSILLQGGKSEIKETPEKKDQKDQKDQRVLNYLGVKVRPAMMVNS